jgi:FKBP-type peptidyl-prolyl cis-trans isomerase FkpA
MNGCSLFVASSLLVFALGCDRVPEPQPESRPASSKPATSAAPEPTELVKEDLKVGEGAREVKAGDSIRVNYVGKLFKNGSVFDSNKSKEDPFTFTVGEGVIEGWSKGVIGMKKGGKRKLTIPGPLAYGEAGSPPKIPGNATLVFEIDLIGWEGGDTAPPAPSASASASGSASATPAAPSAKK